VFSAALERKRFRVRGQAMPGMPLFQSLPQTFLFRSILPDGSAPGATLIWLATGGIAVLRSLPPR